MEENITLEELQVKYAEKCKECETLKADKSKLIEDNETMQRDYNELQKANNKLFMMIDNPAPKPQEEEEEKEPTQEELEKNLFDAIMGGKK